MGDKDFGPNQLSRNRSVKSIQWVNSCLHDDLPQCVEGFLQIAISWIDTRQHEGQSIAAERVLQQVCQLTASVVYAGLPIAQGQDPRVKYKKVLVAGHFDLDCRII